MFSYFVRRVFLVFLPTLLGMSILVFSIMHMIPGSFVDVLLGMGTDISEEQIANIEKAYGLDKPLPVQYLYWIGNVLRGDLGQSLRTKKPVASEILSRLPVTLELTLMTVGITLLIAIPAGVISAVRQNNFSDLLARLSALIGLSIPNFLLGTLLILFVSLKFPILPTTGYVPLSEGIGANLKSMILPSLSLALAMTATVMRMTRSSMLEELRQEYVQVARSKGLPEKLVIFKHALRNSLIPVITVIGIRIGYLLGGTVIIEELFALPGIGRLALNGIYQRDYPVVQGTVLFIAFAFILINMMTDLSYSILDPRIRRED
ncbi:MAG: nickel ABC transporter permease [Chloroflexota bacterium]|nr:nickel ABC transporter permease [Chloroflexota bacterium]